MVLGVVAGLKNGEPVMAGVVGGDCRDKMGCQGIIGDCNQYSKNTMSHTVQYNDNWSFRHYSLQNY